MAELSQDQIRERAYYLWQEDGQPEGGNDWHYWLLAEQQITAESGAVAVKAAAPETKAAPRRKADATAPATKAVTKPGVKADGSTATAPKKTPAKRRAPAPAKTAKTAKP